MTKLTEQEARDMFNNYIDDISANDILQIPTSDIVKKCDPIMYKTAFNDFTDGLVEEYGEYVRDFCAE